MSDYTLLHEQFSRIYDLKHVQAIASWDEASMMPPGGGDVRGRALSTLGVLIHEQLTAPAMTARIDAAGRESLSPWQAANLREIERVVHLATCLPKQLVEHYSLATSRCEQAWRRYRKENNWQAMVPLLTEVVSLSRERAAVLAGSSGKSLYDALLDEYEPGMTTSQIDPVFADLKQFLPGFVDEVLAKQASETLLPVQGDFSVEKQRALGMEVMAALGFDFDHGRLDVSHHPFCGGVPDDVRITTRYSPNNFVQSLMAVIHETGHALYEQGLPEGWRDQPVGEALSSGTHESQSLLMEMQACRARAFLSFMAPMAQRAFLGHETNDPAWSVDNLYRLYTRVSKSFIRVDADEATYPLHVILRYELERDLIRNALSVEDMPEAWNAKMNEYFSLSTAGDFADGCLQDVHWPSGLFGYFPTYSLGAMTAAQLFAAADSELSGLHDNIGKGNFAPLLAWLREKVHSKGKFLGFDDLMVQATGSRLDASWFKAHLQSRYLGRG